MKILFMSPYGKKCEICYLREEFGEVLPINVIGAFWGLYGYTDEQIATLEASITVEDDE